MVPLPSRDQRHPWLGYQVEGYVTDIVHNYKQRLETIWGRSVNRGLRGLLVVTHKLLLIDFHELRRLNICVRVSDTWAWVALRLERQPVATAGAPGAAEDAPAVDEGAQADPAPMQAPQPPPPTPRTMQQTIARLDEEV
nr:hypothetical protein [Tanacetum cinerariifolium]